MIRELETKLYDLIYTDYDDILTHQIKEKNLLLSAFLISDVKIDLKSIEKELVECLTKIFAIRNIENTITGEIVVRIKYLYANEISVIIFCLT